MDESLEFSSRAMRNFCVEANYNQSPPRAKQVGEAASMAGSRSHGGRRQSRTHASPYCNESSMRWIIKRFTKPPAIDFELSYTVGACPERRQAPTVATLSATISDYVQ